MIQKKTFDKDTFILIYGAYNIFIQFVAPACNVYR